MPKTKNAIEILKRRRAKDAELQKLYEEEKASFHVALAIRKAREEEGLTQEEVARKVGTTQSVISRLEDADYEGHSLSMLQRIAEALNRRLSVEMDRIELSTSPRYIPLQSLTIIRRAASFEGWKTDIDIKEKQNA